VEAAGEFFHQHSGWIRIRWDTSEPPVTQMSLSRIRPTCLLHDVYEIRDGRMVESYAMERRSWTFTKSICLSL